jgi:hypothetical protein
MSKKRNLPVAANDEQPDLIIGLAKPGTDGIEFRHQLKREPQGCEDPFVLASADDKAIFGVTVWANTNESQFPGRSDCRVSTAPSCSRQPGQTRLRNLPDP